MFLLCTSQAREVHFFIINILCNVMKKKLVIIILLVLVFAPRALFAQSSSRDTLIKNNEITQDLIMLVSTNNFTYIFPPEESFEMDTTQTFLGLSSEKYPNVMLRIIFSGNYEDDEITLSRSYNILETGPIMRVNDSYDMWYFKLSPKGRPDIILWNIFFRNELFYGLAMFSYPARYDKVFAKGMEKTINTLVIVQRPDILPQSNLYGTGDFDLIPLKFVKRVTLHTSYFTEDGFPITRTKGDKIVVIATAPSPRSRVEEFETAIYETNKIFIINEIEDSILVENITPITMLNTEGFKLSGTLASDINLRFLSYYVRYHPEDIFFMIFAICKPEDVEELDKALNEFSKTMRRRDY